MSDLRRRIDRKLRDAATRRPVREIGAFVLATIIGGALISYATREVPSPVAPTPKSSERLASSAPAEPAAMIQGMPTVLPVQTGAAAAVAATSVVLANAPAIPVRASVRTVEIAPRRVATVAVVPPARPAERVALAEAEIGRAHV